MTRTDLLEERAMYIQALRGTDDPKKQDSLKRAIDSVEELLCKF